MIEASRYRVPGWDEGDLCQGRALRYEDPFGHVFEIYYDPTAMSRRKVSGPRRRTWRCDTTFGAPASAIWTEAERKKARAGA